MHPRLLDTLRDAQRVGFFGAGAIDDAVAHAQGFVVAIGSLTTTARIVDLGSGGGLPGLVLADSFPEVELWLVDRRRKRTDFLERAVRRLGFDQVRVVAADVDEVVRSVRSGDVPAFDVVTARGFGPPEQTLTVAASLCASSGCIVVSEPPSGDRWQPELLEELGLASEHIESVRRFRRV